MTRRLRPMSPRPVPCGGSLRLHVEIVACMVLALLIVELRSSPFGSPTSLHYSSFPLVLVDAGQRPVDDYAQDALAGLHLNDTRLVYAMEPADGVVHLVLDGPIWVAHQLQQQLLSDAPLPKAPWTHVARAQSALALKQMQRAEAEDDASCPTLNTCRKNNLIAVLAVAGLRYLWSQLGGSSRTFLLSICWLCGGCLECLFQELSSVLGFVFQMIPAIVALPSCT